MKRINSKMRSTIDDYLTSRRVLHAALIGSIVLNLILAVASFSREIVQIAIPPNLTEAATISSNKANEAYNLTWANHIAGLFGNVNPGNADLMLEQVKSLLSPNLRHETEGMLETDIQLLKARNATQKFVVQNAIYDENSNVNWIWGRRILEIPGFAPRVTNWTYEMQITPHNGMPRITYFNAYEGAPNRQNRGAQKVNPFLTLEQEMSIETINTDVPVEQRTMPQAPLIQIDLTEDDDNEQD